MSEENVNLVRGMYAGFGKGDIPAVLATLHAHNTFRVTSCFVQFVDRSSAACKAIHELHETHEVTRNKAIIPVVR